MTLAGYLDTVAFFCVTTDIYGNNLQRVQRWVDRKTANSPLNDLSLGGKIGVWLILFWILYVIAYFFGSIAYVAGIGAAAGIIGIFQEIKAFQFPVMQTAAFLLVSIVSLPLFLVCIWVILSFFFFLFGEALKMLCHFVQQKTFERVLLACGVVLFIAARMASD